MSRYSPFSLLIFCFIAILTSSLTSPVTSQSSNAPFTSQCDFKLFDGLNQLERDFQTSTDSLSAHWTTSSSEVIQYEWAATSSLPFPDLCSNSYRLLPDVFTWQKVTNFYAKKSNLQLKIDQIYFVLLRITLSNGQLIFVRSNGIKIVDELPTNTIDTTATKPFSSLVASLLLLDEQSLRATSTQQKSTRANTDLYFPLGATCPFDEANRCRQLNSRNSIADQLNSVYGDSLYSTDGPAATVFRKAHSEVGLAYQILTNRPNPIAPSQVDMFKTLFGVNIRETVLNYGDVIPDFLDNRNIDSTTLKINAKQVNEARDVYKLKYDDDGEGRDGGHDLYEWIIAPGLAGIALLLFGLVVIALIIVIIIVAIVAGVILLARGLKGAGGGGGGTYHGGGGDDDDDPSAFSRRGQAAAGSTDDKTNIEFPDTEIRRLSITHEDAPAAASDGPKRKHPIMESSSSSFRDFRSANV